jgi:Glycosyl hydrolases family 2, TIM barrel domain
MPASDRVFAWVVAVALVAVTFADLACSGGARTPRDAGASADGADDTSGGEGSGVCLVAPEGETVVSIAGTWSFTPPGEAAATIEVPGGGWLAQGWPINTAHHERMIDVPDLGQPQATLLELGAVNHEATLTVDGTLVGTNTTSFTPSVFDATTTLTPGAHLVALDVKGRDALRSAAGLKLVPDAAGWSANIPQGILRSATVRALPLLHVSDVFVRPDQAGDTLSVDVWITNSGGAASAGRVSVRLTSWNCAAWNYPTLPPTDVSAGPGETVKVTIGPVPWGLGRDSYWWPNVPYASGYRAQLHYAVVSVVATDGSGGASDAGAGAGHSWPARFGFRDIKQVGTHYELNGVRVNFRGDSLQGANYDSIATAAGGVSDAYDLLPGFLPPTDTSPGWPRAVDNYQRLNYNVARIHQEPASPYMLDVMDEMGFMVIDETAIRGTNGDQDFIAGLANMLGHAQALVRRDRNHPAVIRWSQSNEPEFDPTNSQGFQLALYQAIVDADPTRPVSGDSGSQNAGAEVTYALIPPGNFAAYGHYPGGLGNYTEMVAPSTVHPTGVGEFIWPSDVTAQGLAWFGTATMAMRRQDASEIRPYTLLSAWASFVPGIIRTSMRLEPTYPAGIVNNPLYGEDNLPDPWSNPILTRVQRAFNPVLVADLAFWNANRLSNPGGAWPTVVETVAPGTTLARQLMVFNDTFEGTTIDVAWEMRADAPDGAVADQGQATLEVPLGGRATLPISVAAPSTGTLGYLILQASKGGQVVFRDDGEWFQLQ